MIYQQRIGQPFIPLATLRPSAYFVAIPILKTEPVLKILVARDSVETEFRSLPCVLVTLPTQWDYV